MSWTERLDRTCVASIFPESCVWLNHNVFWWLIPAIVLVLIGGAAVKALKS